MDKRGCEQEMHQAASLINQPSLFFNSNINFIGKKCHFSWGLIKGAKQGESIDVT